MLASPRTTRLILTALLGLTATGCAKRISDANPADIPALRTALAERPDDVDSATRLGIALYKSDDYQAAVEQLTPVTESEEAIGAAWLYLGLAQEGLESWSGARQAYQGYLDRGRYGPLLDDIRNRLELIVRRELQEEARLALAAEDELTGQDPEPRSIAVFPFRLISEQEELAPLTVALADMMITDLAVSNALTVLERVRVQSLVDEMAMTEAGLTEDATGARAGRMLRAEHVVQGALTTVGEGAIRFDADVLNTVQASSTGAVENQELLEQIFDLEKAAVFQVLDVLGIELTPAERQAIDENRSDNLLAFLAYGEGLQALDRGDYAAASGFFNQAVQLDPGFSAAQSQETEATSLDDASQTTGTDIAAQATNELGDAAVGAPPADVVQVGDLGSTLANISGGVNPTPTGGQIDLGNTGGGDSGGGDASGKTRQPVQESGGSEGKTEPTTARIKVTIRRPGGGS